MPSRLTSSTSGCSPSRPGDRVHGPVAQAGPVGVAAGEPAVVEHEPLDTDLGGGAGELGEPVDVVVEVRRLPRVDQHRAGVARAWGVPPQPAVDPGAGGVEAPVGEGADQPGRGVRRTLAQHHLTGSEQLATTQQALPLRRPFGVRRVVAAPGDVHGPDLAMAEAEPGGAGRHEQGRVVAGAAVSALAHVGAEQPGAALGHPLAAPAAGQVQQLAGPRRHRQRRAHRLKLEVAVAGVGDHQPLSDQALAGQLELDDDVPARLGVRSREQRARVLVVVHGERPAGQARCPRARRPTRAHALQPGDAGEPADVLADDTAQPRLVECGVRDAGPVQGRERLEAGRREVTQRRSPVEEGGSTGRGGREHEAHARPREMDGSVGHAAHDAGGVTPSPHRT